MNEFSHPLIPGHQFSGWQKGKQIELMGKLLDVIYKEPWPLFALGCSVEVDVFKKLPAPAFDRYHGDPWYLALETTVALAAKWLDEHAPNPSEKLRITFDRKDGFVSNARENFNHILDSNWSRKHRLGEVLEFASKDKIAALQAADLLAYEVGVDLERKVSGRIPGGKPYAMRYPLKYITTKGPCLILHFDADSFRKNLWWFKGESPPSSDPQGIMRGRNETSDGI
jgi:hypothetical protein